MVTVYLAGPITGCTHNEALDWREFVTDRLAGTGIKCVNPLRCESVRQGFHTFNDSRFGTARAIGSKNRFDVLACTMTLAYLPLPRPGKPQSYGTMTEMAWANAYGRQTILVTNDPYVFEHPVVDAAASWKLETLDDAIDVIKGVLTVYAESE